MRRVVWQDFVCYVIVIIHPLVLEGESTPSTPIGTVEVLIIVAMLTIPDFTLQVYYIKTFYNKLYSIILGSILHYRSTPTRISERRTPCGKGKQLTWAWKLSS